MSPKTFLKLLKWWIASFLVGFFLIIPVFAADICNPDIVDDFYAIENILKWVGRFASWAWILLGNFAGKLMTNTMVYGEFMHFDLFLWKLWQLARSVANYSIGFIFLYSILKYLFSPSSKDSSPKEVIKQLLIASVFVQSSWFLMMAVVDLSTIGLATVSSFPSQVIANNELYRTTLIWNIKSDPWLSKPFGNRPKGIIINAFADSFSKKEKEQWIEEYDLKEVKDFETQLIDRLLPQPENLWGPLTYLGLSVFQTHSFLGSYSISESNCIEEVTKIIISLILDAGMIILYTFALALFVIILIMRLVVIWIAIIASPLIVLLWRVKPFFKNLGADKLDLIDFKKILHMIFKPVFFALWISIMLIFVVILQGFFRANEATATRFDQGSLSIQESRIEGTEGNKQYRSDLSIADTMKVTLLQGTKSFKDILLALLSLTMMRYFIKLALSSKSGMKIGNFDLDRWTAGTLKSTEKIIGNIGLIPTPKGAIGFNQIRDGNSSRLWDKATQNIQTEMDHDENIRKKWLNKKLWIEDQILDLTTGQRNQLERASAAVNTPLDYPGVINQLKMENGGIKFSDIKAYIPRWVDSNRKQMKMKDYFWDSWTGISTTSLALTPEKLEDDLKLIFAQSAAVKSFYTKVLGGTRQVTTLEELNTSKVETE